MGCALPKFGDFSYTSEEDQLQNFSILLLGLYGSGKTTISKQIFLSLVGDLPLEEKTNIRNIIRSNMLFVTQQVIKYAETHRDVYKITRRDRKASTVITTIGNIYDPSVSDDMLLAARFLWKNDQFRKLAEQVAYEDAKVMVEYFKDKIDLIFSNDYVLTREDILHARHRTAGMNQRDIVLDGTEVTLLDVGGHICERKKWQLYIERANMIVFVIAMDSFCVRNYETLDTSRERSQNCLEASLEVLEKTIQNMKEHNENRSLIVLCNKTDLFTERLKNVAFSSEFSDYQGSNNVDEIQTYVTKRIDNIAAHADFKMLRGVHFVNALDSRRVVRVIESVYRNVTVPTTEPNNIVIPSVVHAQ
jgi:guanine nucleotide-binding protein subunit alpha-12